MIAVSLAACDRCGGSDAAKDAAPEARVPEIAEAGAVDAAPSAPSAPVDAAPIDAAPVDAAAAADGGASACRLVYGPAEQPFRGPAALLPTPTELKLVGTVSEAEASLIHTGETLRVLAADRAVNGTITAVLGSVDAQTRRVPVEAKVPNDPKQPLLAGTYVRAELEGKNAMPVLRFPAGVIRPGSQNEVMIVEAGRMQARRVVFHPAPDGMIYIRLGLDGHDVVVVDPSPEAKDGDPIPAGSQAPQK